jgi:hypothetical protein
VKLKAEHGDLFINCPKLCCMLQLFQLYANKKIPEEKWAGYISMKRQHGTEEDLAYSAEHHNQLAAVLKDKTKIPLTEDQIVELLLAVCTLLQTFTFIVKLTLTDP